MSDSSQIETSYLSLVFGTLVSSLERLKQYVGEFSDSLIYRTPKQFVRQFSDRSRVILQKPLSNMADSSQIEVSFFSRGPKQYIRQFSDRS